MYKISTATLLKSSHLTTLDLSFDVSRQVCPPYHQLNRSPNLPTQPTGHARKAYDLPEDINTADSPEEQTLIVATKDATVVAFTLVAREWNNYLNIEEIVVDASHRKAGLGKQLMEAIVRVAREAGVIGVRAETQTNNVNACQFYKKYGFTCGGYDEYMYRGTEHAEEVALFWYYML